jgi:hypothetical protein
MKKMLFLAVLTFAMLPVIYARQVDATNAGIANASPGDYIIRSSGETVILQTADIEYARKQLGINKTPSNQSGPIETPSYSSSSGTDSGIAIFVVIIAIIHIILTYAMYKMKGGGFACFYFFLAPLALLGLLLFVGKGFGGYNPKKKHIDVTHHYR